MNNKESDANVSAPQVTDPTPRCPLQSLRFHGRELRGERRGGVEMPVGSGKLGEKERRAKSRMREMRIFNEQRTNLGLPSACKSRCLHWSGA